MVSKAFKKSSNTKNVRSHESFCFSNKIDRIEIPTFPIGHGDLWALCGTEAGLIKYVQVGSVISTGQNDCASLERGALCGYLVKAGLVSVPCDMYTMFVVTTLVCLLTMSRPYSVETV